jgi:hypothetical protein
VDEHVPPAVVRLNEPIAFLLVKPLHCTRRHKVSPCLASLSRSTSPLHCFGRENESAELLSGEVASSSHAYRSRRRQCRFLGRQPP